MRLSADNSVKFVIFLHVHAQQDLTGCLQVRNKTGTTDIGLAAFPASYGFFSKCGFDLDREQSTFMTFALSKCNADALHNFQSKPSLLALLAGGAK